MAVNGEEIVPGIGKKQAAVLNNESARRLEHERHLEELGFPKYVEPGYVRHAPVSYDDPDNPTPSRIVNQAGQDLGDPNKDESDHFAKNTYKPAKKLAKEAFLDFIAKDAEDGLGFEFDEYGNIKTPDVAIPSYGSGSTDAEGKETLRGDLNPAELAAEAKAKQDISSQRSGITADTQEASYLMPDPETGEIMNYKYTNPDAPAFAANKVDSSIRGTTQDPNYKPPSFTLSSIEKSMNMFSNLAKDAESNYPDWMTPDISKPFKSLLDKVTDLYDNYKDDGAEEDGIKNTQEYRDAERDTQTSSENAQKGILEANYDFPTYTDYMNNLDVKRQKKDNIIDYLKAINSGKIIVLPTVSQDRGERITPKIFQPEDPIVETKTVTYDPDTGVYLEDGVMKPIIDGDLSEGGYPASTYGKQYGGAAVSDAKIKITEGQVADQSGDKDGVEPSSMGTAAFQPVNIKTGNPITSAALTMAAERGTPIQYTLKPTMDTGANRTAMAAIGLEGSGKSNRFTYTPPPPPADSNAITPSPNSKGTQARLNISPDQRIDPAQRTALATAAYNRELAILSGDSKRMAAYGLGPDYEPDVNKSMEKYQAWIQKAEDEGAMAKVQLDRVSDLADMMHDALDGEDQLPGWIQNKISDSLHNLEASFTHIAYDKKQDMELSKSKEMFSNILQKDNHTSSYRGFVTQPGGLDVQPTAAQQTGAIATTSSGFKDFDPKRFKGKMGPVTGLLEIGERLWGGNDWLKAPETANKLKKYSNKALNYIPKFAGAGSRGPILGIAAVAASGALGKRAIDSVAPKASEETRQTIQDMASSFMGNPVSFLAGDASTMPRKKDGGLYGTSDITSALKDFGSNLFKEDMSLQKDEGGFDAFGRPTSPAITSSGKIDYNNPKLSVQEEARLKRQRLNQLVGAEEGTQQSRKIYQGLSSTDKKEYDKLFRDLSEERGGGRGPAAVPKDFDQRGRDLYRGNISEPGVGEVPDYKATPETTAQRVAKVNRMIETNAPMYEGKGISGRGALTAGSNRGTINTMYDQLLDNPKTSVGRGTGNRSAFGMNPRMVYEKVKGASRDQFAAPPTRREVSEVLDQVADWSASKVKTAARGALKGKKGLLSVIGAAGLGTAFNYLQDKGSDLLNDGGNTRAQ